MVRHRSTRAKLHAPAFVTLATLPLVLGTSSAGMLPIGALEEPAPTPSVMAEIAEAEAALAPVTPAEPTVTAPTARRAAVVDVRAGDIPWAALQGYKRAADILGEVEESCGLSWTLLAAVGQVSSRHGQVADSELGADAVARPDIVAPAATAASALVADTDAGEFDGDADEDRAVGPMQLQPAVWNVAAVDGDGDGRRSPHDVDDAALATAVFLCATGERLGDEDGAAAALRGLNHSRVYVDQVLAVEAEYAAGEFAVADPPALQTIGKLLDTGTSAPARTESARAVKRIEEARPVERRRPDKPAATRTPEDSAPTKPATPTEEPATPKPAAPAPAEEPLVEEPAVEDPAAEEPAVAGPAVEEPAADDPPVEEPPVEEPAVEEPAADDPPVEEPPAEEPGEPVTVVVEGMWLTCDEGFCIEVVSSETGEPVLLPLDLELLGKTDEELAAMVGQVLSLVVVEGTEPLVVVEIVPPETP